MRQNIRRLVTGAAAALMCCIFGLSAVSCGSSPGSSSGDSTDDISVVCTIFPEYDWVRNILGDNPGSVKLSCLTDNGANMHSYQPTTEDIMRISSCDIFIYVGGESDSWVSGVLDTAVNKDMRVLSLMDTLESSLREEELKEGMENAGAESAEIHDEAEYDEHVWLSLRNAQRICSAAAELLCEADPENAGYYQENLEGYTGKLSELDSSFSRLAQELSPERKTLIFGDRFPFRYFTEDYGFDYYAAFVGCSAETEASFSTIAFLAQKADEINAGTICVIEGSDHSIAESVADNMKTPGVTITELDSIQSVTRQDIKDGATYLSIMEKNCESLCNALEGVQEKNA